MSESAKLTYGQWMILELYREFYRKDYVTVPKRGRRKEQIHQRVQAIILILRHYGIQVGEFGFIPGRYGACSTNLDKLLDGIDEEKYEVQDYYEKYGKEPLSLFIPEEQARIHQCTADTKLANHAEDADTWLQIIANMLFVLTVMKTRKDFKSVKERTIIPNRIILSEEIFKEAYDVATEINTEHPLQERATT